MSQIAAKFIATGVIQAQPTDITESFTLTSTNITNQYVDLANVARSGSIVLFAAGLVQRPTSDYVPAYTGGTGGKTRVAFAGDIASGGGAALVAGDVLYVKYNY